jgi:hypothetical protein
MGMDDENLAAGLQRGVGADGGLPRAREQEWRHEQPAEQRGACVGAGAEDRAKAKAEQPEDCQVQPPVTARSTPGSPIEERTASS